MKTKTEFEELQNEISAFAMELQEEQQTESKQ